MTTPPSPPPAPPPPAAAPRRTDRTALWGWLGIVLGLICCGLLGVVFGVLSIQEASKHGKDKILGYVAIACGLVNVIASAILSATGSYPWQ
ncbi:MAG: DUF4190 domain-containing protein [Natronosporangium sp.]